MSECTVSEVKQVGTHMELFSSPIPPAAYVDSRIFELESSRIFGALWNFVGFAPLLREENAFITRQIGAIPVVIQRLGGTLRAFENRCLHRQMPLQWEASGKRRLVCKYHGWAYGNDGSLKAMANQQLYGDSPKPCQLRLKEFAVAQVGALIFVNVNDDPIPIEDQLSDSLRESLIAASAAFDGEIAYAVFNVPWNWKLNFENVLDSNHVQFIHPKSFHPLLDPARSKLSERSRSLARSVRAGDLHPLGDLSYCSHGPLDVDLSAWAGGLERYGDLDDYYNWYIYPNVNFCSVHGKMFTLQQFVPISPSLTEYHLLVFTAKRKNGLADHAGLLWALIRGEKAVIDEDGLALSQLQAKMSVEAAKARHGEYESNIVRMHQWYCRAMGLE